MQLSDLTSKKPEELNSKLHHALGFRWSLPDEAWYRNGSYVGTKIPNYTGSWDAIMPEVRKLTEDQFINYLVHLTDVADGEQVGQFRAHYDSRLVTIALILTLTSQH